MATEVKIIKTGYQMTEAKIVEWWKAEGDEVNEEETLVTLDTQKVAIELPAPCSGVLRKILAAVDETVALGQTIAIIAAADEDISEILDRLAIARFFDTVAVSSIEGVEKPAPEIFLRTLGQLEVAPAMTIHVGDSPRDDYLGAQAAGLTPVLLDRTRLYADAGYRRIERLDGLFGVLG